MKSFDVVAETRDDYGTNNNKRLRKSGFVPGVVYGEAKDLKHIKLSHKDLIINLKNESFNSSILKASFNSFEKSAFRTSSNFSANWFLFNLICWISSIKNSY